MVLFPPREKTVFHESVLAEILQERVVSSRGRRHPRGVKRKLSKFPLRPREAPKYSQIDVVEGIEIK